MESRKVHLWNIFLHCPSVCFHIFCVFYDIFLEYLDFYSLDEGSSSNNGVNHKERLLRHSPRPSLKNHNWHYCLCNNNFSSRSLRFSIRFIAWCCNYNDLKNLHFPDPKQSGLKNPIKIIRAEQILHKLDERVRWRRLRRKITL